MTLNKKTPLTQSKEEDIQKSIWEELRMITLFLADIKIELEKNTKNISEIERRMTSVFDFDLNINKICEILKQIEQNTSQK